MRRFRHQLIAIVVILLSTVTIFAQEPIRFARTPDISPDGKLVAFSYLGDIWTVESIGGTARQVTRHIAHDVSPVFSPDGKSIAFSSNRHGNYDVFVIHAQGGKAKQLTFDSATDVVTGWSPDGKSILFASTRDTAFPPGYVLYSVPLEGGRAKRVSVSEAREGVYSPKGDLIAYVRGPGTWYRKGYRGSSNDDIWICNADGSNNRRLTNFDGQDNSPMWSADGRYIYYVSEVLGKPANIVRQDVSGSKKPRLVTMHKEDAVRKARISANGEWIVYECGADLWIASTKEGIPARKLAIEVHADDVVNTEANMTFTSGASEFALTADEKHVALVVHGEIFLMPMPSPVSSTPPDPSRPRATRLTSSPAFDHGVAWSPDSQKIIFASDRNGHEDLYLLESDDKDHPKLVDAEKFKQPKQLTDSAEAEFGVSFSPDGKRVAYISAGKLWTMNPDGTDQKVLVNETQVFDYEWSPDSKWVAYARMDGSFASELYIIPAAGGQSRDITQYATFNGGITWSQTGNKLAFISDRRRNMGMCVLSLQKPAVKGAPASSDIDWEDIHLRVEQPAAISAEEGAISPDSSKIAFRSNSNNGDDLWVASTDGKQLTRLTTGSTRPHQIQWSKTYPGYIYFRDGRGMIRMARQGPSDLSSLLSGSSGRGGPGAGGGEAATVPFEVKMTIRRDEEFGEMFDQSWRALREHFYDSTFHGVDWYAVRSRYRPLVKHIAMKEDLYVLISLMMGELNASHLGISGAATVPDKVTADLGLLFDESYEGPGLKIAEILKRGPADRRGLTLKPGEIIVAIDGVDLTAATDISDLLNEKVDKIVTLQVVAPPAAGPAAGRGSPDTAKDGAGSGDPRPAPARRKVEVQAAAREKIHALMYDRWVENNARRVTELSKGKLGYIHIPSMDDAGLDRFVRALYSENFDKEAIVLDVRFNGGGFTHDQVLNYLGGQEHTIFRQRDGGEGMVLRSFDRKWTKPIVVLINNRSYSDAEIFPSAIRQLGMGKLVGLPTGGHVIGTSSVRLIDGSTFRIPRTGVFTVKGVNMEKEGVAPDILVDTHPDELAKGIDAQLDKAVEVLEKDVVAWKKTHPGMAGKPNAEKPTPGAATPMPPMPMTP